MNIGFLWAALVILSCISTAIDIRKYRDARPGNRGGETVSLVLDALTLPCLIFLTVVSFL